MVVMRLVDVAISTKTTENLIRTYTVLTRRFDLRKAANALAATNVLL